MGLTKFIVVVPCQEWTRGQKRSTLHKQDMFVTSVSFEPGDGFNFRKFSWNRNKDKAMKFGKITAEKVAQGIRDRWRPLYPVRVEAVKGE